MIEKKIKTNFKEYEFLLNNQFFYNSYLAEVTLDLHCDFAFWNSSAVYHYLIELANNIGDIRRETKIKKYIEEVKRQKKIINYYYNIALTELKKKKQQNK